MKRTSSYNASTERPLFEKRSRCYLHQIEETRNATTGSIGQQLDLFSIQELAGHGLIFWHPKGGIIRKEMEDWMRPVCKGGFSCLHAARSTPPAIPYLRSRRLLRRKHVRLHGTRRRGIPLEAHELSRTHLIYRDRSNHTEICRYAWANWARSIRYERSA